jgi:hypothetical protein
MTTKVSSLDECTSSPFLGQISASHRLTAGNTPEARRLSAELKALEADIFYDYPANEGIRNIKSIELRSGIVSSEHRCPTNARSTLADYMSSEISRTKYSKRRETMKASLWTIKTTKDSNDEYKPFASELLRPRAKGKNSHIRERLRRGSPGKQ